MALSSGRSNWGSQRSTLVLPRATRTRVTFAGGLPQARRTTRMNRLVFVVALAIASGRARADVSVPTANAAPFPLGTSCAAALRAAQTRVGRDFTGGPDLTLNGSG